MKSKPDGHGPCPARKPEGFTLLEVLISIMMVSLIMTATYAVLFTTLNARDLIEKEHLEGKIGPAILDLIEKDISSVWCWNIHDNDVFNGESGTVSGERADRLQFITTTNSSYTMENEERQVHSDVTEVSYLLRQNPRIPELLELWRRQDFHVDDKIAEGGLYERIYSRINSFQVTYYGDLHEDAEKLEEWNAAKRGHLPSAIEIYLVMEIDPTLAGYALDDMSRERLEYHRVIFLPQTSALTMAVRPVIPTFEDPDEAGGDGEGDGKGDGATGGGGAMDMTGGGDGDIKIEGPKGGSGKGDDGDIPPFSPPPGMDQRRREIESEDIDLDELLRLLGGQGGSGGGGGFFGGGR
jgi:prepilin-type N-terminal cleavage/methylation domain-containing protein